jgi:predicted amidohydrolase
VQWKKAAAIDEATSLKKLGVNFLCPSSTSGPIHRVAGVSVGILICSELLNIERRGALRGKVDLLFIPAWNRDLSTFDSLVNATALDLHCFVVVANNRRYGDSRIRVPARESYQRDVCQLRGGEEDHFVCAVLRVKDLRAFQRAGTVAKNYPFKPLPEGYLYAR